jgi:hypothetical protein
MNRQILLPLSFGMGLMVWLATALVATAADLHDEIDAAIESVWQREKITPAGTADDATFLRRVYIDLCGTIPAHDEALAFLADSDSAKRARLVDRLLADPRYAQHQAEIWDLVLFGRHPVNDECREHAGFAKFMRESFAANRPFNEVARSILKAEGDTIEQGSAWFLLQYMRRPEDAAVAVSQIFLGVQLQCARCHDHPHENWKQLDFYGMAAFYARLWPVHAGEVERQRRMYLAEKNTGEIKFTGPAKDSAPGKQGDAVPPKFLLGGVLEEPDFSAEYKEHQEKNPEENKPPQAPKFSRKDKAAEWITADENPFFARAVANRIWAQFMGKGLVHPVDNMSESNPPSHPELLTRLSQELVAHRFDLKWYIRELLLSRTYQLSSVGETAEALPRWFERARVRPLSAEELCDSWRVAGGYDQMLQQSGKKLDSRYHPLTGDYLKRFMGEPVSGAGDFQGGLNEHLYLNNGELERMMPTEPGGLFEALEKSKDPWESRVDRLFVSILSRPPSDEERTRIVEHLSVEEHFHERLREAMWALMSCSEFRFNH